MLLSSRLRLQWRSGSGAASVCWSRAHDVLLDPLANRTLVVTGRRHRCDARRRLAQGPRRWQGACCEPITGIGGIIGSVLAIYGRIVATKKVA
ncbi:hypothetical protein [Aestuariivirga sp.]|uniref:hypothetical protein n=1 Tax=Aestuariivirga sp. TaxID=2650926 RepID=UPI00359347B7